MSHSRSGIGLWLFAASASLAFAQSYTFTTLAGPRDTRGGADGAGRSARFNSPSALTIDGAGTAYVADTMNYTVRKITPDGVVSTLAGAVGIAGANDGTGTAARFGQIYGLAADGNGNVYVADYDNHTIRKITPTGRVLTIAGNTGVPGALDGPGLTARFRNPVGIAIDPDGNLFVADRGNRTIRQIAPDGTVTTFAGTAGLGGNVDGTGSFARFNGISGLTIDGARNLYLTDNTSNVVRKVTPGAVVTTLAGSSGTSGSTNGTGSSAQFNVPNGIVVDGNGNLFVADSRNNMIRKITPAGVVSTAAGGILYGNADGQGTTARFFVPYALALDPSGNFWIADTNNHSVRKMSPSGAVSTVAGSGGPWGSDDGASAAARFYFPNGIAVDAAGNAFVTDGFNYTVRKVTPEGNTTTFAGSAGDSSYFNGTGTAARFGLPWGLTFNASGVLYVCDEGYSAIRSITPTAAVATFAGQPALTRGSVDGTLNIASFGGPSGAVFDTSGNLFVADTNNHVIRKITPSGAVSTLAGLAGIAGSTDGAAAGARFSRPMALTIDAAGTLYVVDEGTSIIRKVTPDGNVSTLAGLAGSIGSADGVGSTARFYDPIGIALEPSGNLIVADSDNNILRRITPAGVVTTIGGTAGPGGAVDGTGSNAKFLGPTGVAFDANGALYVADAISGRIVKGVLDVRPAITIQPRPLTVLPGSTASFSVTASGGGLTYQWRANGALIPGATGSTYTVTNATTALAGNYSVDVANSAGNASSQSVPLSVISTADVGRITNLAIRSQAGTGNQTLIVGVAIGGAGGGGNKPVLIRAAGPTLGGFGVANALADPKLEVYVGATKIGENDNWGGAAQIATVAGQVGAFAFPSAASKDAAYYNSSFAPGTYSVQISGNGGTGVALAEIYDATAPGAYTPSTARLTNISARTQVGTGADVLIAGFTIGGQTAKTVLIRAIGPTLSTFGVAGALLDPRLELDAGQTKIGENDDWGGSAALSSAFLSVGAFPLAAASKDAVVMITLSPGSYTAQVSGAGGTSGVALVEVYEIP